MHFDKYSSYVHQNKNIAQYRLSCFNGDENEWIRLKYITKEDDKHSDNYWTSFFFFLLVSWSTQVSSLLWGPSKILWKRSPLISPYKWAGLSKLTTIHFVVLRDHTYMSSTRKERWEGYRAKKNAISDSIFGREVGVTS